MGCTTGVGRGAAIGFIVAGYIETGAYVRQQELGASQIDKLMMLGNLPRDGSAVILNKWYFGFEILPRVAWQVDGFAPYIFMALIKVIDFGDEHLRYMGKPQERKGFVWRWRFPLTIYFSIRRNR